MALQFRRGGVQEESSDESDEDYVPPEQVEVEDEESDSAGADLEPSSGGDTDLDVGKRKRKRKVRGRNTRTTKRLRNGGDDTSDNNDETTSNETLLSLPLRSSLTGIPSVGGTSDSKSGGEQSSSPSPGGGLGVATPSETEALPTVVTTTTTVVSRPPAKTGVSSLLAKLGKKKATVLEKSQQGWSQFKSANKIEEELAQHNKGKGGFLERKDFLDRANVREYEFTLNSLNSVNSKVSGPSRNT